MIGQGFPVTFELGTIALALALRSAFRSGRSPRFTTTRRPTTRPSSLAVAGIAIPSFVLLPFLALLFGVYLHWLPVAGWEAGSVRHLALPVFALALPPLAYIARLTRGGMLEVLGSPFIRTALAKGLPLRTVIVRHALRPALVPVARYLAPAVASIMTGSLVVESIAGLPGIGRYLVQGALNRDYTLVLGMVIIYSALLIAHGTSRRSSVCLARSARQVRAVSAGPWREAARELRANPGAVAALRGPRPARGGGDPGAGLQSQRSSRRSTGRTWPPIRHSRTPIGSAPTGWGATCSCARSQGRACRWRSASWPES